MANLSVIMLVVLGVLVVSVIMAKEAGDGRIEGSDGRIERSDA